MVTLHEILAQAENEGVAVGHFNVSDLVTLKAVFESATDENVPVVVGVSEGERQFFGLRQIVVFGQEPARGAQSSDFPERRSHPFDGKRDRGRESRS